MKKFHLVHYVKDCESRIRTYSSKKKLDNFVKKFKTNDDNWIDFTITDINGNLNILDTIKVKNYE